MFWIKQTAITSFCLAAPLLLAACSESDQPGGPAETQTKDAYFQSALEAFERAKDAKPDTGKPRTWC